MTCEDCVHYDICTFHLTGKENKTCLNFLDKADVVEVVRCEDCVHAYINQDLEQSGRAFCNFWITKKPQPGVVKEVKVVKADDFCSYGRRREQENDLQ